MYKCIKSLFLCDIASSLLTTFKYLFKSKVTINYPYEKNKVSSRFRGEHFLKVNQEGKNKCIACKSCEKICPIRAIKIESIINNDRKQEVVKFDIDLSRCIYCGLCTEICPVKAINQSTNFELATSCRKNLTYNKEKLLNNGIIMEKKL